MLHLLANPGPSPDVVIQWWILIVGAVIGLAAWAVLLVRELGTEGSVNIIETISGFVICVVVGCMFGFVVALVVAVQQISSAEHAWDARVQHWLSAEYGVTVTVDDVTTLDRGKAVIVTVDGRSEPLTLTTSKTGKLIPSTGQVLLPTSARSR